MEKEKFIPLVQSASYFRNPHSHLFRSHVLRKIQDWYVAARGLYYLQNCGIPPLAHVKKTMRRPHPYAPAFPPTRPVGDWATFGQIARAGARSRSQAVAGVGDVLQQMQPQLSEGERAPIARTRGLPKGFCDVRALLISWKKDTQQRRGAAGAAGARGALGAWASSSSRSLPARSVKGRAPSMAEWLEHHDEGFLWLFYGVGRAKPKVLELEQTSWAEGGAETANETSVAGCFAGQEQERSSSEQGSSSSSHSTRDVAQSSISPGGQHLDGGAPFQQYPAAGAVEQSGSGPHLLPQPTKEQKRILGLVVEERRNVVVEAKPGAGKTTTALMIAKEFLLRERQRRSCSDSESDRVLLLVFNKNLARDTRERAHKCGLMNLECRTVHAWMVHYLDKAMYEDTEVRRFLLDPSKPRRGVLQHPVQPCSVLVFDEAHDLCPLLFKALVDWDGNGPTVVDSTIGSKPKPILSGIQKIHTQPIPK